ncbi:hypothetical protein BS636_03440 [Acinetobacter sp. LoGeW2-3]|uniref:hypothetical protein n=1 Tax=Acinetobacter sp. LoGeW2-3 TaxID=1808001 RepID=UPI000C05C299|nr:hypothetical protein [Acinetobacter sp. LoGeW2-3]ATO18785.1 hypothetical protein BS636_03440 [Acinetobacter sp. LoGeW2-3]
MLIYVIPLILLIIVLIVVKKRQDAQGSDKPKANTAKARKTASSARTTPAKSRVVEEPAAKSQEAVALSADLRKKIERLISEGNFFAAEAQINQALKKDNRQHELYLLLLDIHIQQKDEFAISQLINHVRSLGLEDILAQAEAKKAEFENSATSTKDTIDFPSAQLSAGSPVSEPTPVDNSAAFEELSPTHSPVVNDLAFDELQQENQPQKAVFEPAPSQNDIQPLEFNFEPSFSKPASDELKEQSVSTGLEFNFSESPSISEPTPTTSDTASPTPNFSFDLNTSTTAETESTPVAEPETAVPVIDFSLDLASSETPEVTSSPTEVVQPLDFSFSVDTTPTSDTQAEVAAPEFDLSSITTTEPTISATPAVASELDFKLDAVPEKPASAGISFEIPSEPAISTVNQNDPLIQSFPELKETDEVVLNLELAEQYIQLGAYDAAREILSEKEADYSPQQRTHVDLLLNRIAS